MLKAWLYMCAENYLGVMSQEEKMKEYCEINSIEIVGSTMTVHWGRSEISNILTAMSNAVENHCDYVMVSNYSALRYSPETYMELLSRYLEFGVSIYALDRGDVFEQIFETMPEYLKKRLG